VILRFLSNHISQVQCQLLTLGTFVTPFLQTMLEFSMIEASQKMIKVNSQEEPREINPIRREL
jgi:hypothetical protein